MLITDLPTPAVLVDSARLTRNLSRMQSAANARGLRLRPHAKTHKSPRVAALQIERGAVGICCAKLGEAEVFADEGIADIRLPYPLNPVNADRVFALARRVLLSFIVDDPAVADAWSRLAVARGTKLDVLIKVDVGFHRCGIDPALTGRARHVAGDCGRCLGFASAACSVTPATDMPRPPRRGLEAVAIDEAQVLRDLAAASGVALPGDQRRRDADRAVLGRAGRRDGAEARRTTPTSTARRWRSAPPRGTTAR